MKLNLLKYFNFKPRNVLLNDLINVLEHVDICKLQYIIFLHPNEFIEVFDLHFENILPLLTLSFWNKFLYEYSDYNEFYEAFERFIFTGEFYIELSNEKRILLVSQKLEYLRKIEKEEKIRYIDYADRWCKFDY